MSRLGDGPLLRELVESILFRFWEFPAYDAERNLLDEIIEDHLAGVSRDQQAAMLVEIFMSDDDLVLDLETDECATAFDRMVELLDRVIYKVALRKDPRVSREEFARDVLRDQLPPRP